MSLKDAQEPLRGSTLESLWMFLAFAVIRTLNPSVGFGENPSMSLADAKVDFWVHHVPEPGVVSLKLI
jgi:hypothetical protein